MVTVGTGVIVKLFLVETRRPGAVQSQLLAPVNHGLIILVQVIITLPYLAHMKVDPPHQPDAHPCGRHQPYHGDCKQGRRQPGQPAQSRHTERGAVNQLGQMHKSDSEITGIGTECRQQRRPPHLFQLLNIRGQHTAHQIAPQAIDHAMSQPVEGDLGAGGCGQQRQQQQGKLHQHHAQLRPSGQ